MSDDKKKPFRARPQRDSGPARPAKGGAASGKRFRKHEPPRPYEKGGEPYAKRSGDADRPKKAAYAKRHEADGRQRIRDERENGPQPKADRPGGHRKAWQGGSGPGNSDRPARTKPFAAEKYWGKRPGKAEREAQKRGESGAERVYRPKRLSDEGEAGARRAPRSSEFRSEPRQFTSPRRERPQSDGARPRAEHKRSERPAPASGESGERIAKRLARAGISSRRDAEDLIAAGRVKVNGKVLESPAFNVTVADRIELDGIEIPAIERTRLFLLHKPAGVVTTNRDPEGRKTVFDVLPEGLPRLMTVGRLDINTEGLLLLTNDGGLARVLELPATGWLRRYRVRVHGKVNEQSLSGLKDGIAVDGVFYGAVEAALEREQGTNAWLTIGLREGKNREVKNILGALGLEVTRLIRISYGPFQLGELGEGQVLEIKGRTLRDQLGERLVEESGANFDAEIAKPFSNKAVRRGERPVSRDGERPQRTARPRVVEGEGGLIKNFRRDRAAKREDALDRLSTRRERRDDGRPASGAERPFKGGKQGFGKGDERTGDDQRGRRANVWMAPGARPQGKKNPAAKPDARGKGPAKGRPRGNMGKGPKGR